MIGHSLKNIFDSLGFAYDFAFCQNKWSLKIFQNVLWKMSFKNDNIYTNMLGGGVQTKYQKLAQNEIRTPKKSMPKTMLFSTSIFSGFGLDFGGSWASNLEPSPPRCLQRQAC